MSEAIHATVWNEHTDEQRSGPVAGIYPHGLHTTIAEGLRDLLGGHTTVTTATLDQPGQGLPQPLLENTDVLLWWGHKAHHRVTDETVARVQARVLAGMGLVVLHSGHLSKIFTRLMGTSCNLRWRKADERELVWTVNPTHPIARGVPHPIQIPQQEMYGEFFDIPQPDELVFVSSFTGGEVFRSGCCFTRGNGRIFYFSPGDELYPVYHHPQIRRVLANAVRWAHNPVPSPSVPAGSPQVRGDWFTA
ncbi:ThuA domain-containing protein [Polymorphospora lycopeni]|uniref:ThuA domain-containing protein n=1 Tax=Polymorphospora lycopeni TaxID=3140240 RepID=A0ABV5CT52_9ACTN